jgi:hypothetical protein
MAGFYLKMIELGRISLAQVPGYWQDAVYAAMGAGE